MPRRLVNPYYIQIDVEMYGTEGALCYLGAFLALSSRHVLEGGVYVAYGKDCGDEDCVDVANVTREALRACGIDAERVEKANLLHTFYNTLRFLGVLVPVDGRVTQAKLCEWLARPWGVKLRARLSPVALSFTLVYIVCKGVFEDLAASMGLGSSPRGAAYTLLGAFLLLNLLAWYGETAEAKPPAVLVGLGLLACDCSSRCAEILYEYLSREGLVEDLRSVERKLRGMCKTLRRAVEILRKLASRGARIPGYCVQRGVTLEPLALVEKVVAVAEATGERGCIEAIELCRGIVPR